MTFGSLFSGIGGLDLGIERAGMTCEWQVEIDPYCLNVLHKHWPDVPKWRDIRTFPPRGTAPGDWYVDLICGGFPCQDISTAGKRLGIDGPKSGLWREFSRIIGLLRPKVVVVENSPNLISDRRSAGRVFGDLAKGGYDAEWRIVSVAEFGAPHIRKRCFIAAYAHRYRVLFEPGWFSGACRESAVHVDRHGQVRVVADTPSVGKRILPARPWRSDQTTPLFAGLGSDVEGTRLSRDDWRSEPSSDDCWWSAEPNVVRVVHGLPHRMDRIRGLGNAVVPQVAEFIGRLIMEREEFVK